MSWGLLLNSFGLATLVSFFAMAIGWFVAVFLAAASGRWRVVVLCGSLAAFSLPPFLVVNTWLSLLGNVGLLKPVLPLDIYSFGGAAWVLTLMLWPVPCLLPFGALKRLTPELLDAEPGLAGWPLVKGVLLPLSRSALMQSGVIMFALAFNNIAVPAILQVNIFPAKFWVEFSSTYNFKLAWQYGWVLALLPLAVLLIFRGREIAWPWESQGVRPEILADRLGGAFHRTAVSLACCAVVLSLLLPLGHLLLDGRTWSGFPDAIRAGSRSIWNSFWFASLAALLVAWVGALTSDRKGCRLAWLLFFLPGVLLGVVLISVFNRPWLGWFYGGSGVVMAALGLRYFALGWEGMRLVKRSVDADLQNVTDLSGVSGWQRWRHLFLPQAGWAMAAVWYVVYLLCLWDTETVVLIVPPGGETLALRVFNLLHYGHHSQVNALCLILLLLAVLPLFAGAVVSFLVKRRSQ